MILAISRLSTLVKMKHGIKNIQSRWGAVCPYSRSYFGELYALTVGHTLGSCMSVLQVIHWGDVCPYCRSYIGELCVRTVGHTLESCMPLLQVIHWGGVCPYCRSYIGELYVRTVGHTLGSCMPLLQVIHWGTVCPYCRSYIGEIYVRTVGLTLSADQIRKKVDSRACGICGAEREEMRTGSWWGDLRGENLENLDVDGGIILK